MSERATPQQPSRLPGAWTLTRDVLSFLGGWVLIFLEVSNPEVRESVLVLAGGLVGVPGAFAGATSVVEALRGGTGGSPSQPQQEASSSSP